MNHNLTNKQAPNNNFKSLLINLLFNIIIPTLILTKLSGEEHLGVRNALIIALAFPIIYGLQDFIQARKINFFSALGVINVALTGGIGLLELDPKYVAIKEATIPAIFGIATLISLRTPYPLINTLIFNDMLLNIEKIKQALKAHQAEATFRQTLKNANYIVAGSFFLSSFLNFTLARIIVVSPAGTEAFNNEIGRMTALSYPVIALPSTLVLFFALWYLFNSIHKLTGLDFEDMLNPHHHDKQKTDATTASADADSKIDM